MSSVYEIKPVRAKLIELADLFRKNDPDAPAEYGDVLAIATDIAGRARPILLAGVVAGALDVMPGETRAAYGDRLLEVLR